jgi:hypothetical protein
VARPARDPRRQAARLGLLVLATACAAAQEPPGGPPDFTPPVLREIRPDSFAVLPGFRDPVVFGFDEVITERSPNDLAKLVLISPRHEEIRVTWKRTRLEVRPGDGWRPDAVYRVMLLPGITDLRNNRLPGRPEVVFSTGPEIPDTRIDADVIDWAAGRLAAKGLLEAYPLPITDDSLAYVAQPDSSGVITLTRLPPGDYLLFGVVDENANNRRDRREAFDTLRVRLDSALTGAFWAFVHDTLGPQLREVTRLDSVTTRVTFSQRLDPATEAATAVTVRLLPDSTPVPVTAVWTTAVHDSIAKVEAAARDSAQRAAADSAAAGDSVAPPQAEPLRPPRDTAAAPPPPLPRMEPRPGGRAQPGEPPDARQTAVDTARVAALLRQRPPLRDQVVVRLATPLVPGGRYLFEATAANLTGATATSRAVLAVPDTTAAAPARR